MTTRRQTFIVLVTFLAIIGVAAFVLIGNLLWGWDLPLGVRSLVREAAAQRAADEARIRRETHEFDLKRLARQLAALRGDQKALVTSRFGAAPPWAEEIRAAYFERTPCPAYLRWRAGNDLRSYFEQRPDRQFVTVEDLKTTRSAIEDLWQDAGAAAAHALLNTLPTPHAARRCDLPDASDISEAFISIIDELGLKPEDLGTTSAKIAKLVLEAR
ncbi:MAG: hypothetical protein Q8R35_03565 [bacterium]|nr:hypothetical protein [bacterium]